MTSTQETRKALRALRSDAQERAERLRGAFREIVAASADTNADDEHDPEGATIAFERSQVDALARQADADRAEAEAALERLEAGTYGVCEVCGEPIGAARLEARPAARRCVRCAARR
ncbi:MAG: TraR/DksA family transcriptional regulator [Cellulomonadaceae bacterium]